jgi:5-formyltetrahydrofolate cyclo-ligase
MARHSPRHDRDAGGALDVLAAKAALREEVWSALTAAHVARFPGAAGRIPNFTGAEAAAERLRERPEWRRAARLKPPPQAALSRHLSPRAQKRTIERQSIAASNTRIPGAGWY